MGMTIDESLSNLKELQKDYQQFHDEVWKDSETYSISAESLKIAIETMRKYEKIQETYKRFQKDDNYHPVMAWLDVMEVIEDGNDD